MPRMYYRVFGLGLTSNRPLPGLSSLSATTNLDVELCLGSLPPWFDDPRRGAAELDYVSSYADEHGEPEVRTWKLNGGAHICLRFADGIEFVLDRAGTKLWAVWPDDMSDEDMATYLLGPVLGFMLRLRGAVCLHASAIALGDRAIALLGSAGAGKSTTAAAFARLGFPVLTDDIVALDDRNDRFLARPGDPRLRLWPASVNALYGSPEALPRMTPTWDKRYLDLRHDGYKFEPQEQPLAAIYILAERLDAPVAPVIENVAPRDGFMTVIAHTYANSLLDRAMRAREFELVDRLVKNVVLRRVHPHADVQKLTELCQAILDDFHAQESFSSVKNILEEGNHV